MRPKLGESVCSERAAVVLAVLLRAFRGGSSGDRASSAIFLKWVSASFFWSSLVLLFWSGARISSSLLATHRFSHSRCQVGAHGLLGGQSNERQFSTSLSNGMSVRRHQLFQLVQV